MSEIIPPRTSLERELVRIWEEVLQRSPIGIREDFFDLGGTSAQAVRVFSKMEELVHQRLPISLILGAPTIERLAVALLPNKSKYRKAYVAPIQPEGRKPVFFCIGGGLLWRPLAEHMGPDQPVLHVGLDPREINRLNEPNALEKLARDMVSALCDKQPQGPYYLGGVCCDAIFAYEVARQLTMYGHEVGLLALVEPFRPREGAIAQAGTSLKRFAFRVQFRLRELNRTGFRGLPQYTRDRWNGLKTMLSQVVWRTSARTKAVKQKFGSSDLDQIVYFAASGYKPKSLGCPTVVVRCKDWPMLSAGDEYFGWRKYLTGPTETYEVPGDHLGVFDEPNASVFAEKLTACLENAGPAEATELGVAVDADPKLIFRQSRA